MRTYSSGLKIAACITLAFYLWTFGSVFEISTIFAATNSGGAKGQKAESGRQKTTEDKFQESLDRIREAGGDRAKLKTERGTIEQLDTELQRQFKETEARIKDLPDVIKQRHRDFTKKYAENLSALKTHFDSVEKAKTDAEVKVAAEKAKAFLDKAKGRKTKKPFNPSRLPSRTREMKRVQTS